MCKNKIPYMHAPCSNCPFRNDKGGIKHLGKKRAEEILNQLPTDGFVCHKTVDYSKRQGDDDLGRRQCGGALILSQKTNTSNVFLNLFESMYGEMPLSGKDLIVDSLKEFIDNQS
jgi:hypothetical protein